MKKIISLISILELINLTISIVPTWNFEKSTIDLFSDSTEHSYDICNRLMYDLTLRLEKKFTKDANSVITQENIIYFNNNKIGAVEWEDIESFYSIGNIQYICPKGKYHMFIYKDSKFTEMIPDDFSISGDWDLLCYYQKTEGYMFVGFVNKHPILYSYKISDNKWEKISKFDDGLYDFKWVTEPINSHDYPMKAIVLKNNIITLKGLLFTIVGTNSQITVEEKLEKQFTKIKSYSNSFFNRDKNIFILLLIIM